MVMAYVKVSGSCETMQRGSFEELWAKAQKQLMQMRALHCCIELDGLKELEVTNVERRSTGFRIEISASTKLKDILLNEYGGQVTVTYSNSEIVLSGWRVALSMSRE